MLKIENNENYEVPNDFPDDEEIGAKITFRISDDGLVYFSPMDCYGGIYHGRSLKDLVEYFIQSYKEDGYTHVELISVYVEVESTKKLKKVKN